MTPGGHHRLDYGYARHRNRNATATATGSATATATALGGCRNDDRGRLGDDGAEALRDGTMDVVLRGQGWQTGVVHVRGNV
ncbi:hypothetical protein ABT346_22925 [Micromonospora peucetia]|uniref:hypothetical protein n=1 Tax=Micromonospora peucetia TaxID=47871 RepID=UPI003321DDD0